MIVWVINVVQHGFKELKMLIIDTKDKKAIVYCFFFNYYYYLAAVKSKHAAATAQFINM